MFRAIFCVSSAPRLRQLQMLVRHKSSFRAVDLVKDLEVRFKSVGIVDAETSAKYLVASVFGETNLDKFQKEMPEKHLDSQQMALLEKKVECRLARMPLQYIIGDWDFLDLTLKLRPPVFIPRPETEELASMVIDHIKALKKPLESLNVVEIGCGSGAISLAFAKALPGLSIVAADQSRMACQLTQENAASLNLTSSVKVLNAKLTMETCNEFLSEEVGAETVDVVVSNPPYVLRKDLRNLPPEIVMYEDLRALDGGSEGLSVIEPILVWSARGLKPGGRLFIEADPCHPYLIPDKLEKLKADDPSFRLRLEKVVNDFLSIERFLIFLKD